jgi:hypothetical protein
MNGSDSDRDLYRPPSPMTKQDKLEEIRRLRESLEATKPKDDR